MRNVSDALLNAAQLRVKSHTLKNTTYFDAEGGCCGGTEAPTAFGLLPRLRDDCFAVPYLEGHAALSADPVPIQPAGA